MKVLVTGANGQLGSALQREFPEGTFTDINELDISDSVAVCEIAAAESYEAIINAAGFTAVDKAEDPAMADIVRKVNVDGVHNLAVAAKRQDIPLVHISTDYVFDGKKNEPYTEDDATNPLGVYATSKRDSEYQAKIAPKNYTIRTSWVIGDGHNFVRIMLSLAKRGINPTVVDDQIGRLTFTTDLAIAIRHLLDTKPEYGIYHITNTGEPASWAQVSRVIFKVAGVDNTVTNISTAEYFKDRPNTAKRPLNSVMDLSKAKSIGIELPDWHDSLYEYVKREI